jgi:hypothetical protein
LLTSLLFTGVKSAIGTMRTDTGGNALVSFIKGNTRQDEPILYIGMYCRIYLKSNRPSAGYYPYYGKLISFFIESYIDELVLKKPRLLVYGNIELPKILMDYINNNYTVVYEYGTHKICKLNEI